MLDATVALALGTGLRGIASVPERVHLARSSPASPSASSTCSCGDGEAGLSAPRRPDDRPLHHGAHRRRRLRLPERLSRSSRPWAEPGRPAVWAAPAAACRFGLVTADAPRHGPRPRPGPGQSGLPACGAIRWPGRSRSIWACNRPRPIWCSAGWRRCCAIAGLIAVAAGLVLSLVLVQGPLGADSTRAGDPPAQPEPCRALR